MRLAAELGDHVHQSRVDAVAEGLLNNLDGLWGGDAEAADELRLQPCFLHGGGDGFAATVHDHGVDAGDLQKHNIAHDLAHQTWVFHGGAAHFDQEGVAAEGLQVGQGLDEDGGLVDGGVQGHAGI